MTPVRRGEGAGFDVSWRESKSSGSGASSSLFNTSGSDLDRLLERMERLEKNGNAAEPSASLVEIVGLLEIEGFLPPLLCLVLQRNLPFAHTVIGQRIFQKLCKKAALHYENAKLITSEDTRFLLTTAKQDPLRFFQWLYYVKLVGTAPKEKISGSALASRIKECESVRARQTLARDFFKLHESQVPKNTQVQTLLDSLYTSCEQADAARFQQDLPKLLHLLENHHQNDQPKRLYFKEIAGTFEKRPKNQDPFVFCSHQLKTAKFFQDLDRECADFVTWMIGELDSCDEWSAKGKLPMMERAYQISGLFLHERHQFSLPSLTEACRITGKMTATFRKLDDKASEVMQRRLHYFCGCHLVSSQEDLGTEVSLVKTGKEDLLHREMLPVAKQHALVWPTLEGRVKPLLVVEPREKGRFNLSNRSVVILSCSMGMFHDSAQKALAGRAAKEGMHVYSLDGPEEVLASMSVARKFGLKTLDSQIYGVLERYNCWRILKALNWLLSGTPKPETVEQRVTLMTRAFLERSPDLIMSTYSRDSGSIAETGFRLGLPFYTSTTGFHPGLVDITAQSGPPRNPFFVQAVYTYQGMEFLRDPKTSRPLLRDDQIVQGGFPVREAFLRRYTQGDVNGLRIKWNVDQESQVVLILSGGSGVKNRYAETIVEKYRKDQNETYPNIHLFVVCGQNAKEEARLKKKFTEEQAPIPVTVLGLEGEERLAELYTLAAAKNIHGQAGLIISAKGGGGTVAECAARGVRLLAHDRSPFIWEKFNLKVYCTEGGWGDVFAKENEMWPKLLTLLTSENEPKTFFNEFDSEKLSMGIVQKLITSADKDRDFQAKRASVNNS